MHSRDIHGQSQKFSYTKFWTFFALQNFKGQFPQKLYPHYHPNLEARNVAKYRGATATTPKL